jgi:hypothetical protein
VRHSSLERARRLASRGFDDILISFPFCRRRLGLLGLIPAFYLLVILIILVVILLDIIRRLLLSGRF